MAVMMPDSLRPLLRPITDLIPYERNARRHKPEDIDRLCKSLEFYGWTSPIIAWAHDGRLYISAGHLRYQAALRLGMAEVPVLVRDDWDEATFRAYTIWDNQSVLRAEWDIDLLRDELQTLDLAQFDLSLAGFDQPDIQSLGVAVSATEWPDLPDAPRPEFHQRTFVLHDSQVPVVDAALRAAKAAGEFDGPNQNSNGNALTRIAEAYLAGGEGGRS